MDGYAYPLEFPVYFFAFWVVNAIVGVALVAAHIVKWYMGRPRRGRSRCLPSKFY